MRNILQSGLTYLKLPTDKIPQLCTYARMLQEKNEVMNLTAITDEDGIAKLHFLDSAVICAVTETSGKKIIDVGTGAGFPGLVIKVLSPESDVTLLDSLGKRITWLQEVTETLGLEKINCIHGRAEEFARSHREEFDIVTSRAVASLDVLAELCIPLLKIGGTFIAMKSTDSDEEIANAKGAIGQLGGKILKSLDYTIPETEITHRLVIIEKIKQTPKQFPRTFSRIKKQPLK